MGLSLALIVVPGAVLAFLASTNATTALERAVGRQLATIAGGAAQEVASVIADEQARLASWADQELMREVLVGDVDKRISRFLVGQQIRTLTLLDVIATDASGAAVAGTDPAVLGTLPESQSTPSDTGVSMTGPYPSTRYGRSVLEFAVAIPDPEEAASRIGTLRALYDWRAVTAALADVQADVATQGIGVELLVLDVDGVLIGGAWTARAGLEAGADLRAAGWGAAEDDPIFFGVDAPADALIGHAAVGLPVAAWSVVALQPRAAALAPVREMNQRLAAMLGVVIVVGLTIAVLLAHRITQPIRTLTKATTELARVGVALVAIPVRSHDEIGELTTAFNRMASDLRRAHDDLVATARLATVGEIAAGIAHEVRTPLGILRGSAQMLGRSLVGVDAQQRELVDMIVGEVDRIERVVSGLTELAKPRPPAMADTPLEPLLEHAAEFVAGQAEASGVGLRFERTGSESAARCDREQIYQVLLNLLVNALQVQPGGGEIRLRVLPGSNGSVGFEVSDDGPGMTPETQARIFSPFYTKREGGTGLGLALVERIVRAHEGTVKVDSVPGHGATFRIELPKGRTA